MIVISHPLYSSDLDENQVQRAKILHHKGDRDLITEGAGDAETKGLPGELPVVA
jgi:hypothetical protein